MEAQQVVKFRCYFCDEEKEEVDPHRMQLSLKLEHICQRCYMKTEAMRRLRQA